MTNQLNLEETNVVIYNLKMYCVSIFTYYLASKIIASKENRKNKVLIIFLSGGVSIICTFIKFQTNFFYSIMCLVIIVSLFFSKFQKKNMTYSIMIIALSLSINYIILFLAGTVTFLPNYIIKTQNNYIEFISLMVFYIIFIYGFTKIKRFKKRIDIFEK